MKRKVIQIADSTQLVSLPRSWALKNKIKKGDELDVEEKGNHLLVSTEAIDEVKKINIDLGELDRSSIIYLLRNLYRAGYDEIDLTFENQLTDYIRKGEKKKVVSVIHQEVNRLIGFEVIQQKEKFCKLKSISKGSISEFETLVRRIFLIMSDTLQDFIKGLEEKNPLLIETIEEDHNILTRFISYCMRLLNKYGYPQPSKVPVYYCFLSEMERTIDNLKNTSRIILKNNIKLNESSIKITYRIKDYFDSFREFFFKFDIKGITLLSEERDAILNEITSIRDIDKGQLYTLSRLQGVVEVINILKEHRIKLEYV